MSTTAQRQRLWGARQAVTVADAYSQILPANDIDTIGAKSIDFYLYLDSITGTPTAAKLTAKFQKAHATPGDNEFVSPVWQDFDDHDIVQRCLGGVGWGYQDTTGSGFTYARPSDKTAGVLHDTVVSSSLTVGYFATHRITAPFDKVRVKLTPTFTGGTSPAYLVSPYWVVAY
jgi:hypothetical protein